jgi:sec-independent protein translocase protein TatA
MSLRSFGVPELLIILAIIILLFGVGRIGKVAGELGKGIRSFKDGLKGDEAREENKNILQEKSAEIIEEKN